MAIVLVGRALRFSQTGRKRKGFIYIFERGNTLTTERGDGFVLSHGHSENAKRGGGRCYLC